MSTAPDMSTARDFGVRLIRRRHVDLLRTAGARCHG